MRRNVSDCNDRNQEQDLDIFPAPKLAWLLRRFAQTAEDFDNFDNLVEPEDFAAGSRESGFDDLFEKFLLPIKNQQEYKNTLDKIY